MFNLFGKKSVRNDAALTLYATAVNQARNPVFYESFGVADTRDGRFDMVMLHVFLILRRLKGAGPSAKHLAQAVFDTMFADMDQNLREMGAGDVGVAHRIKDMAKAFYGRIAAYDEGLDGADAEILPRALRRNLYRKTVPSSDQVAAMSDYVRRQSEALVMRDTDEILGGVIAFDETPRGREEKDD